MTRRLVSTRLTHSNNRPTMRDRTGQVDCPHAKTALQDLATRQAAVAAPERPSAPSDWPFALVVIGLLSTALAVCVWLVASKKAYN